jgi:hypothetical protein
MQFAGGRTRRKKEGKGPLKKIGASRQAETQDELRVQPTQPAHFDSPSPAANADESSASAERPNDESAKFRCSQFLDLVEAAAWAAATKPEASPQGYRKVAREFLAVLEVLAEHPGAALSVWVYLAAQTLECTLKAYLTKLGLPAPVRRKGHDLINLWRTAAEASAAAPIKLSIAVRPPEWCVMLNVFHEYPFLDRYPGVYGLAVKTKRTQLAKVLGRILAQVDAAFQ